MTLSAVTDFSKTKLWTSSSDVPLVAQCEEVAKSAAVGGVSFRAEIAYALKSEYFSGSDRVDLTTDATHANRICRDWVLGSPLAKASGWKRLFRRAWHEDDDTLKSLFGAEEEAIASEGETATRKVAALKGELKFHHSFFPKQCLETSIITPRDPTTGKVKKGVISIHYEVVRAKAETTLTIDYLPRTSDQQKAKKTLMNLLSAAVKAQEDSIGGKSSLWGFLKLVSVKFFVGSNLTVTLAEARGKLPQDVGLTIDPEPKK